MSMLNLRLGLCLTVVLPVLVCSDRVFAQTAIPAPWAQRLFVGDFNGDGKPDFLIAESDPSAGSITINIYLGKGDGTFSSPIVQPIRRRARSWFMSAAITAEGR